MASNVGTDGPTIFVLLKVGHGEHMHGLRDGRLFCRRLSFYSQIEGKPLPHQDAHEGLQAVYQSDRIEIIYGDPNNNLIVINSNNGLIGQVIVTRNFDEPVFCLHAIHTGDWTGRILGEDKLSEFKASLRVPDSMNKFGTHVWLITNLAEFAKRLGRACVAQNIDARGNL
jgi:hypothetical protein